MSNPIQHEISSSEELAATNHRTRWYKWLAVAVLGIAIYTVWQMWSIDDFGHSDDGSSADCGIVLGAAAWHNKPSPVFKARLDHAVSLYETKRIKAIILTGGFGKGADYAESEVAEDYCMKNGVPAEDIYIEKKSQTTEENLLEARNIMQEKGYNSSLIVSDPWHLKRACNIADYYDIPAKPSATKTSLFTSRGSKLKFIWKEFQYIHVWKLTNN